MITFELRWPHSGERLSSGDPGGRAASEESAGKIQAREDGGMGDKTALFTEGLGIRHRPE